MAMPSSGVRKVLIALSSADFISLASGKQQETGNFLSELAIPLQKILKAGLVPEFANPTGDAPHLDPMSDSKVWFMPSLHPGKELDEAKELIETAKVEYNFSHPLKFVDIDENRLQGYEGIFLPGGHSPMTDLWSDKELGRILMHFHNRSKPTAVICHAPVALLSTMQLEGQKEGGGKWAYLGYHMTCYSDTEEKMNETMWGSKLQFKAESTLREAGAVMEEGPPLLPKVVHDRELITGQGPTSASALGDKLVEQLNLWHEQQHAHAA